MIALILFAVAVAGLVLFNGWSVYKWKNDSLKLEAAGIQAGAVLTRIYLGGTKMGESFMIYRFHDQENIAREKKEVIGREIDGKDPKIFKEGDELRIRYLGSDPQISQITGNADPYRSRRLFMYYCIFFLFLILTVLIIQAGKAAQLLSLYRHGAEANGMVLSKNLKTSGKAVYCVEIDYQFNDRRGKLYRAKESSRNIALMKGVDSGKAVTVLYNADKPERSTVLL